MLSSMEGSRCSGRVVVVVMIVVLEGSKVGVQEERVARP